MDIASYLISRSDVFNMFIDFWSEIRPHSVYLADKTYITPLKEEVEEIVIDSHIDEYEYARDFFDCDDFALLLHAYVIHKRYRDFVKSEIPKDKMHPLAFGQIWYRDFFTGAHSVNLCITRDAGILFIEPQKDKVREAKKGITIDFIRI